ncbi:thioredoxin-dependent thiol peroxidase [Telmatospirillum sp.]|uniref:thioredoxin-dependent thiol peroxidase n=1 Tax=Telmatospirillum sp. TaxID=2079197 RepID=UPI00283FC1B1|nr:thioredoxin-dependent thiol peroxidase [Telmatospirillum sp.]MDR3439018.1 thioredoxin-dependent thiol peroxidase [Telmatospirillum sp.]
MTIDVGSNAPDFTLPTDGGGSLTLSSLKGRKVIVYFYPKDDTPGCTKEACAFQAALPDFSGANAAIVGISKDDAKSHDKFKAKYNLNFTLVSDTDGTVCEAFGVWVEKVNYGKKYMGIERSTFLLDEQGVIAKIWRKVKVDGHSEDVLAAVTAL